MSEAITENFEKIMTRLAAQCELMSVVLHNMDRRRWDIFNFVLQNGSVQYDAQSVHPDVPTSVHALFSRQKAGEEYIRAHTDESDENTHIGHAMASKAQVDILAGLERDFRARHISRIRLIAHEAARRRVMGHSSGPILGDTIEYIKSFDEDPTYVT